MKYDVRFYMEDSEEDYVAWVECSKYPVADFHKSGYAEKYVEFLNQSEKKEDLTFQEACAAIGRGECVSSKRYGCENIYGPNGYYGERENEWSTSDFNVECAPFQIVPDPSLPLLKETGSKKWTYDEIEESAFQYGGITLRIKVRGTELKSMRIHPKYLDRIPEQLCLIKNAINMRDSGFDWEVEVIENDSIH